jgi:hypothetical protein
MNDLDDVIGACSSDVVLNTSAERCHDENG